MKAMVWKGNRERIGLTLFRNTVGETAFAASPAGVPARIAARIATVLGPE